LLSEFKTALRLDPYSRIDWNKMIINKITARAIIDFKLRNDLFIQRFSVGY
jgi:hypothetical protein